MRLSLASIERQVGVRQVGVLLAALFAFGLGPAGCQSNSTRRMGEAESLQYKVSLLRQYEKELTSEEQQRLLYHRGRTRADLDAAVRLYTTTDADPDEYRQWFHEQVERDRAQLEGVKRRLKTTDQKGSEIEWER
jgi:hypothetical protein